MPQSYTVQQAGADAMRIDVWLASVSDLTRSRIKSLIASGCVSRDGVAVRSASQIVKTGEAYLVEMPPVASTDLVAQAIPLDILFEDESLIVLAKPPGLVVHPAVGHVDGRHPKRQRIAPHD